MGEFTNGPWRVSRHAETYVEGPDDRGICSAGGYKDNRVDAGKLWNENIANAHLIAAAPDMFEALKGLIDVVVAYRMFASSNGANGSALADQKINDAKAALSKASPQDGDTPSPIQGSKT